MRNLSAPPEFQGLRYDLPLTVYFRHLPHWRQEGATYFVTFRLIDALPKVKLHELRRLRTEWAGHQELPANFRDAVEWSTLKFKNHDKLEELYEEAMRRIDKRLDEGAGSCLLKDRRAAGILAESLHHFDGKRYVLGCYVIMPNHCHAILTPTPDSGKHGANDVDCVCFPLERILQSWKRRSAFEINGRFRRSGSLWQDESYDRILRDGEHLYNSIQYIGRNPKVAQVTTEECLLWIRPEWLSLGWSFG